MPRRKKRELEEEHENHERWMVTYADMVTLLMVLFIVMFAMGQVDESKYVQLKASLSAGFGQSSGINQGGPGVLAQTGGNGIESIAPTDEELLIARDTVRVVTGAPARF